MVTLCLVGRIPLRGESAMSVDPQVDTHYGVQPRSIFLLGRPASCKLEITLLTHITPYPTHQDQAATPRPKTLGKGGSYPSRLSDTPALGNSSTWLVASWPRCLVEEYLAQDDAN
ncbi:hypothetical protein CLCR_03713 [Cladophialophora carrionii]|uniref:Uncharacterized protein n=1 Tax=Cladophialophora carrionii TaxID=86049 RepID=A0A1C1CH72_9EURO|nr:hypothetical protein CLCR_03713 [Cladophialophora carrionii]